MGKSAGLVAGVGFAVVGGFVGGLFTAGAFSSLGASIGLSVGTALFTPKTAVGGTSTAPTVEDSAYDYPIGEFAGRVGNVRGGVVTVARNGKGEYAGVLVVSETQDPPGACGGGESVEEESYFLIADYLLGRAMGGALDNPDPLFVDKIEIEEGGERRVLYDRDGETPKARGYELTQTISSVTGRVICETCDELRLYTGTVEQNPDSALSEFYPDGLPAYRGTAHVVFNRLKVKSQPTFYFTVRSTTTGRRELISQRLQNVGIPAARIDVSAIPDEDVVLGKQIVGATSAREVCEKLARPSWCNFAFDGQRVKAVSLLNPFVHEALNSKQLGAWAGSSMDEQGQDRSGRLQIQEREQTDMCSLATVSFLDRNQAFEGNTGKAPQSRAAHSNNLEYDLSEVGNLGIATRMARALRDEDWLRDCTAQFNLLPGHEDYLPGDVVPVPLGSQSGLSSDTRDLGTRQFLILEMASNPSGSLEITNAVPWAAHPYTQPGSITGPGQPEARVQIFDAPLLVVIDSSPLSARNPDQITGGAGLVAIVSQSGLKKWKGASVNAGTVADGNKYDHKATKGRGIVGRLISAYTPTTDTTIEVEVQYGALYSITENDAARGCNLIGFESGLYVSFATATPIDYDPLTDVTTYTLNGLQPARYGTDDAAFGWGPSGTEGGGALPTGTKWGLLRDKSGGAAPGVVWLDVPLSQRGKSVQVKALSEGPSDRPSTAKVLSYGARNLEEYAPTVEQAALSNTGDLLLSGRARTRFISANTVTSTSEAQLSARRFNQGFKYEVRFNGSSEIRTLYTLDEQGSFDFVIENPPSTSGTIALTGDFGPGRKRAWAL